MSKDYKGYELVKAIHDKEIKDNTEIEVHNLEITDNVLTTIKYVNRRLCWEEGTFNTGMLCDGNYYFRLIEEEPEINIQAIEEIPRLTGFDTRETVRNHFNKINELVRAIRQLDNQINNK